LQKTTGEITLQRLLLARFRHVDCSERNWRIGTSMFRMKAIALFAALIFSLECQCQNLERDFFDRPAGDRVERLRTMLLEDQYKIFRYGLDRIEPPVMGLALPIAERGAAAVPFLMDQLKNSHDDITVRDILLVFEMMQASGSYKVSTDGSVMDLMSVKTSGMKDKEWQTICLKQLQRIKEYK
jgi:hypothetical protein